MHRNQVTKPSYTDFELNQNSLMWMSCKRVAPDRQRERISKAATFLFAACSEGSYKKRGQVTTHLTFCSSPEQECAPVFYRIFFLVLLHSQGSKVRVDGLCPVSTQFLWSFYEFFAHSSTRVLPALKTPYFKLQEAFSLA